MTDRSHRAVAIVGLGAILPDAPSAPAFWTNVMGKRYSISEVPPDRWSVADYYDPDPDAPDKTYTKIGGWVRGFAFDWKRFHTPPRVAAAMDQGQQWAVTVAAEALADYGYPSRPLDTERTGVVIGTAMGGELHYQTHLRIAFPEFARALRDVREFTELPPEVKGAILGRWHQVVDKTMPPITEDTMPGELANIVSGRVANVLNLRGPNFITDAACASSFAAVDAAMDLLFDGYCDAVLAGGVDRNMGISSFVKFCKIGALSATGTRPFGDGADGFVMGEGAALFLLRRLADAERDGDRIYAVVRGAGGSSDGKGKGITAPNPIGQKLAIERAWRDAGLDPATASLIEAHGTSTKVGDVVEVQSLAECFGAAGRGRIGLGSAKSNVGHLKAGAGAAGLLKAVYALHYKQLPPTLNAERPNPHVDFAATPFVLLHEAREWERLDGTPRRCGVSAYGFGGTNFHLVLEEHVPGALTGKGPSQVSLDGAPAPRTPRGGGSSSGGGRAAKAPMRGILALGAPTPAALKDRVEHALSRVRDGALPPIAAPAPADLEARERLVVDFGNGEELVDRLQKAERALGFDTVQAWKALQNQGVFRGSGGPPGKIAFLFPGQGSQYVNMGRELAEREPVAAEAFAEADRVMAPILGRPLTSFIFVDPDRRAAVERAEQDLMQTAITQPAVLTVDHAILRMLDEHGFGPDWVMGHSLGEYGALVAAGVMPFAQAVEASAARGREMTRVSLGDNGWMAAVLAPLAVVEETLGEVDGYVVAANINSMSQAVIGGEAPAVARAIEVFTAKGFEAFRLPVSHAFHTRIVAPAAEPLRRMLDGIEVRPPRLPLVANVTGERYPEDVGAIKDMLAKQIASPVQWVKGLQTLHAEGVRTFVEVGPKKALKGFTDDVLGDRPDVISLFTNHPKTGAIQSFNQALCGLYAAGYGRAPEQSVGVRSLPSDRAVTSQPASAAVTASRETASVVSRVEEVGGGSIVSASTPAPVPVNQASFDAFAQLLTQAIHGASRPQRLEADDRNAPPKGSVVVTGAGLGLPGAEKAVMDPSNTARVLRGEQFIDLLPERFRLQMARKHVTRVVKSEDGSGRFETIEDTADVIKLAGRPGTFDPAAEYGIPEKLLEALDTTTALAIAAGLDALREAGIPLVQTWRKTTTGKYLPDRWMLPESMRDETGVIFASAFPGYDRFAEENERYYAHEARLELRKTLEDLRLYTQDPETLREIHRRLAEVEDQLRREPYTFDRRFLFRVLAMGHSQFAEYVGARGPNGFCNAACASTAQAIALSEDWIRAGRCRRVVVVAADNVTSEHLIGWIGAGFLATGAAATDDKVAEAAVPFDRRRHGTLLGMGAAALVLESQDAVEERGMRGIVELLSSEVRNSAFHGTRLDVDHVAMTMESLVASAERRFGVNRQHIAPETVFVSHETYTPARGGSASAEVAALRRVFGPAANEIVMANTKGFTGHPMGVGVEDVIAVRILEHGIVPPVPNFKEVDPDLGPLTLSRGGRYPVKYAIHLAAGFGSQVALTLLRHIPGGLERVDHPALYQKWLDEVSGYDRAEVEVSRRVLRVTSKGVPDHTPSPSRWTWGTGPVRRAPVSGDSHAVERPAQMRMPVGAEERPTLPFVAAPLAEVSTEPAPGRPWDPASAGLAAAPAAGPWDPASAGLAAAPAGTWDPASAGLAVSPAATGAGTGATAASAVATSPASVGLAAAPAAGTWDPALAGLAPASASAPSAPADKPAGLAAVPAVPADTVSAKVLAIIAEKTGYPPDMLEMDLDLEADLGVDTVKQAEMFAAVRETFGIERAENLRLRDFPTLRHVVQFVLDHRPDLAGRTWDPASAGLAPAPVAGTWDPASAGLAAAPAAGTWDPALAGLAAVPAVPADTVSAKVLAIIAEKTGYPPDMLEMDLDLEADLGVDTVKQAEMFAAVRETFGIERAENLRLRDFPTLRHVVKFVYDHRPELVPATAEVVPLAGEPAAEGGHRVPAADPAQAVAVPDAIAPASADPSAAASPKADAGPDVPALSGPAHPEAAPHVHDLDQADRVPRRVVVPVLRPPLDWCKATGVALDRGARVLVVHDGGGAARALNQSLAARGVSVLSVPGPPTAADLEEGIRRWIAEGPVTGVFWLPGLDVEPVLETLDLEAFRELARVRVKNLYTTMRALYDAVAAKGTFLVSATRMGGWHGQGPDGTTAPLGGAVSGFTKAYKRERPDALVKVVDFPVAALPTDVASRLVDETLLDPGVVEVGYRNGLRWTLSFEERSAADGQPGLSLNSDSVFVVTGAAGGITSAIVGDLAAASGGTFYLLDVVPAPDPADPGIALLRADRERLKLALIEEVKGRGEKPTPVAIDRQVLAIERADSALRAVEAVERSGGRAVYRSVDLLDGAAVAGVVAEVRQHHARIDVLLHAGGIEISRPLPDKEPAEFERVFDIKADGFFSLLKATEGLPIGVTVVFSSVAGRFGNAGQCDYAAANGLLCAMSRRLLRARPGIRPIAIDWTAWGGIGMATRGSIPKIMEMAGIEMLAPEVGIPTVRRELVRGGTADEIIVGGRLGILAQEWDAEGGLDLEKANAALSAREPKPLMVGRITGATLSDGFTVETALDPAVQPFLHDHQIEGTPVLPGVMGSEAFAQVASVMCPGWSVARVEHAAFHAPFKFYRMQPATLHLHAVGRPVGDDVAVSVQLRSVVQPRPELPPQVRVHFSGQVRMTPEAPAGTTIAFDPAAGAAVSREAIYGLYFHGPAYRVLSGVTLGNGLAVGSMSDQLPPNTEPAGALSLVAPRLIELCFQTAGVIEAARKEVLGLPTSYRSVGVYRQPEQAEGLRLHAVVGYSPGTDEYDAQVVDDRGRVYIEVSGYRTVALPGRRTIQVTQPEQAGA